MLGGPGSGKSTMAAWLFAELKKKHYSIELISEFVKNWAIAKRPVVGFDQVYLSGKQLYYEYRYISNGVKNIITDSPVLLSACYTRTYFADLDIADAMEAIVKSYEIRHPSINIFLNRDGKSYRTEGRYQTKEDAIKMDVIIKETLDRLSFPYKEFSFYDDKGILEYIEQHIDL